MQYETVREALFKERLNRFVATVELDGCAETVHVKNTGRCRELLIPGGRVILARGAGTARKTRWDLVAVWKKREEDSVLINMDAMAPNAAVAEWLPRSGLFAAPTAVRGEVTWGNSRFDFEVTEGERRHFVEVKGVTLEMADRGFFPTRPPREA